MKEFQILLENYWITKEEDKDLYFVIKDALPKFKQFVEEKLGWAIYQNKDLIKIEKIPSNPENWMGITDFTKVHEYVMFVLLLSFLEEKAAGEQFILSEVSTYITNNYPEEGYIDWDSYSVRKGFVKMMKKAGELKIIDINDGDEKKFESDTSTEVLYTSTGISVYFMRNFNREASWYNGIEDFINDKWFDVDLDRGMARSQRVYSNLILSPAIYNTESNEEDFRYMKNVTHKIADDMAKYVEGGFHLSKNCAMVNIENDYFFKDIFPNTKAVSDIVLIFNKEILDRLTESKLKYNDKDIIEMKGIEFREIILEVREKYRAAWSKEYREMGIDELEKNMVEFMSGFKLLEEHAKDDLIKIMPAALRFIGTYPKNWTADGKENK